MKSLKPISLAIAVLFCGTGIAQQQTVNGIVSDITFTPIPGANVMIKHTQRGIQTDFDGKFSIKAEPKDTLVFSFVGMLNKEVPVGDAKIIEVKLLDGIKLNETVGPAYYPVRKGSLAAQNTIAVKESEIKGTKSDTVTEYNPTKSVPIRLGRPANDSNQPLYIVDGKPIAQKEFETIKPETIESVTILKDSAATALYGITGKYGVIIIKTKKLSVRELRKMKRKSR
jgi:TonB-dependent SusC/RagA subfamily outer membrane receptor